MCEHHISGWNSAGKDRRIVPASAKLYPDVGLAIRLIFASTSIGLFLLRYPPFWFDFIVIELRSLGLLKFPSIKKVFKGFQRILRKVPSNIRTC